MFIFLNDRKNKVGRRGHQVLKHFSVS